MTIGMLPQSVFFGALALIPFAVFLLGNIIPLFTVLGVIFALLFSFAFALLVWLDFAQWAFDKFINPKIEGAKVGRGIYNKDGTQRGIGRRKRRGGGVSARHSRRRANPSSFPAHQTHRRFVAGIRASFLLHARRSPKAPRKQAEHRGRYRRIRGRT